MQAGDSAPPRHLANPTSHRLLRAIRFVQNVLKKRMPPVQVPELLAYALSVQPWAPTQLVNQD